MSKTCEFKQNNVTNDTTDLDNLNESHEKEITELLNQKKQIDDLKKMKDEETRLEKIYHEDVQNNLNIFLTWMRSSLEEKNLYKFYCDNFNVEYRIALFKNIVEFFRDETFVTDEILFYWKYMVIFLLSSSKKYKSYLSNLEMDVKTFVTNFRMVREKYVFRCFIDEDQICYFKENGTDYYVS